MLSAAIKVENGYDSADRLTSKATPAGTLTYTYDSAGHVASISSSNTKGASMSYTYDNQGRLSTVVDNRLSAGHNTTTYTYDDAYNVAYNVGTVTYPNSLITAYTYDQLNRVTGASTSSISSYTYQLGATGNRTSATEQSGRTLTWNYDNIYRLTSETIASDPAGNNGSATYGLDPVGNRTSATSSVSGLSPVSGAYNTDDQLAGETYDANGNVTATGGKTFTYNSENQLVSMNSGAVTSVYDGDGNRVAKTVAGVTTKYLVDDLNPTGYAQVIEEAVGGSVQREYTYGLQRISQNQLISGAWTANFYVYDGLGTVRQLTNSSGAVTDTYSYDAFGNQIGSTGSTPNNYLYRSEQFDSDLGLYNLRARYYNPITGRFLTRDPADGDTSEPSTLQKYLYAGGDPVNLADPSSRSAMPIPLPPPPGPQLVPPPEPTKPQATGLEYALIVGAISIPASMALPEVRHAITCEFHKAESLLEGLTQNLGSTVFIEQEDQCTEKVKSCKSEFPDLTPIRELPGGYIYLSEGQAFQVLQLEMEPQQLRKEKKRAPAQSGPCPVGGMYKPGWHTNVRTEDGDYAGSLVGCPVCDDTSGEPRPDERWAIQ